MGRATSACTLSRRSRKRGGSETTTAPLINAVDASSRSVGEQRRYRRLLLVREHSHQVRGGTPLQKTSKRARLHARHEDGNSTVSQRGAEALQRPGWGRASSLTRRSCCIGRQRNQEIKAIAGRPELVRDSQKCMSAVEAHAAGRPSSASFLWLLNATLFPSEELEV